MLARRFVRFAEVECRGSSLLYERLALGIAADAHLLACVAACDGHATWLEWLYDLPA